MMFVTPEGAWSLADPYAADAKDVVTEAVGHGAQVVQLTSVLCAIADPTTDGEQNLFVRHIADLYGVPPEVTFRGPVVLAGGFIPSTGKFLPLSGAHAQRCLDVIKRAREAATHRAGE